VFTGHGQNDAGGHFHHETLGQLRHVNEPVLMHPDIDESTEVRDICDRGGRRSGRKRPLLADIRQTTNSVNPLCVIQPIENTSILPNFAFHRVGDSSTVEQRTLTPSILVRILVPQPGILLKSLRICSFLGRRNSPDISAR
jgi:hypothetical protein